MKSKLCSVEQIVSALKQPEAGLTIAEIARKLRVTEGIFYAWKKKYTGLKVRELKQLREENDKLKRKVVHHLITHYQISERREYALTRLSHTACRY